jgi:hypothetical protein
VNRVKKNYGVNLENEISIPDLSSFSTRKEYNEWKQKASSFTNRNNARYQYRKNKKGLVYTVAELNEFKRLNAIERNIAKEKSKKYKDRPFMRHGQQIGTAGERFGMLKKPKNIGFSVPAKFNINNFGSRYDLEKRREAMERRANPENFDRRLENFKERYLFGLDQTFNGDEETYEVIRKLSRLSAEDLYNLYLENVELQVLFNPSPDKGVVHGVEVVDENDHRDTLFEVDKIVDGFLDGTGDSTVDLLKYFPNN